MNNPDDAEEGATVYLRPQTKQAPTVCYKRLAAVLVSTSKWPFVTVRIFDSPDEPRGREIDIHRDNVGLRRKIEPRTKEGDGQQNDGGSAMVGKPLASPVKPIHPDSGYEEPMLF